MSFYGGEKSPIKLEEEMFDSIEDLVNEMSVENIDDLMTSAIHTAQETMHSFAATYYLSVYDPRYNTVANLALLNMTCSFMYEIGYIDHAIKKQFDYCANEYLYFEGIRRVVKEADDMDIGTGISTGSKLSSEQFPISARKPRSKRVKYDFRNLSKNGREKLKAFEEVKDSFSNFATQWMADHWSEIGKIAIQSGLEFIPGIDFFKMACALLPVAKTFEKILIKTKLMDMSLTSLCGIIFGTSIIVPYMVNKNGLFRVSRSQAITELESWLPFASNFAYLYIGDTLKEMSPRLLTTFRIISIFSTAGIILKQIKDEFYYVFKPQNKAAWIQKLVGGNGNPSDIDERMLVFDKHSSLVETFKSNKSVVGIDETSKFFKDHEDNIRKFQRQTVTANKAEIKRIEGNREEKERDYYEKEEIDSIGDMLSESTKIVELVDEAILKSETAFTKILAIDDGLDRFEKFKDAYLKLNQRSNNERLNFKRAAGNLFTRLKNLDFGDDSTTSECIKDIYGKMKTLDDYNKPLHGPLNPNEIAFVNSLSNDAVVGCPRIAQGAQGRGHGGNDDDDDDDDDGGGDDDGPHVQGLEDNDVDDDDGGDDGPHVPGLGAVDGDNRDGVDGVDGDPPNRSGVRGKRQAQSPFRRVQSEQKRLDNHGKRAARRTNRATIVDEIVDRFRVTRF